VSRPSRSPGGGPGPPAWARPFVYGFLTVVLATSALGVEQWPFTGWRLFSQTRSGTLTGWQVVTVDGSGRESPIDFADLGRGFRGATWRLADFPAMSAAERDAVCRAWADAVTAATGTTVTLVRAYRTRAPVPTDRSQVPAPAPALRWECARR
jgi:hypothetical protein